MDNVRATSDSSERTSELTRINEELRCEIERRQTVEAALRQSQNELKDLLAEAEKVNRLKDEFLATISHELRTPLNAILGYADILVRQEHSHCEEDEIHRIILRNARAQIQIVDDILDISRIITGCLKLTLQPLNPSLIVIDTLESVRLAAIAKQIDLKVSAGESVGTVGGDPTRLQQIIWNLLSNAIKFTPKGGLVEIDVRRSGSQIEIEVADSGQGIDPEFLPHVFDRFRQEDGSLTRLHGGLGLGLSIVRHLVELHGGTVQAASAGRGKGATFTVHLPVATFRSAPPPSNIYGIGCGPSGPGPCSRTSGEAPILNGVKVLVVDDSIDALTLIRAVLIRAGAEVAVADSAEKAGSTLHQYRPDVIVSDLGMPGEDGLTFMRKLRAQEETLGTPHIPAAALTAHVFDQERKKALAAGFEEHIGKPVDIKHLVRTVAGLAGRWPRHRDKPAAG